MTATLNTLECVAFTAAEGRVVLEMREWIEEGARALGEGARDSAPRE